MALKGISAWAMMEKKEAEELIMTLQDIRDHLQDIS